MNGEKKKNKGNNYILGRMQLTGNGSPTGYGEYCVQRCIGTGKNTGTGKGSTITLGGVSSVDRFVNMICTITPNR